MRQRSCSAGVGRFRGTRRGLAGVERPLAEVAEPIPLALGIRRRQLSRRRFAAVGTGRTRRHLSTVPRNARVWDSGKPLLHRLFIWNGIAALELALIAEAACGADQILETEVKAEAADLRESQEL